MDWQEVNRNRTLRAAAVFLVLITPMFLAAPVLTLLWLGGIGVAIAAVRVTTGLYRRRMGDPIRAKYAEHPSRPLRFLAKLATGYGSYLVAFYTVVALLGVITLIGHFG